MTVLSRTADAIAAMEPLARALVAHDATGDTQAVEFQRDDGIWYAQATDEYFTTPEGLETIDAGIFDAVRGRVLDIGAATGRHCLELQQRNIECVAMDVHPALVDLMRRRGVINTYAGDLFELNSGQFDTICLLMDTIGAVGSLNGLATLFDVLRARLAAGGQLVLNGESVMQMEDEPMTDPPREDVYPGELEMRMRYGDITGASFAWLYVDIGTLTTCARDRGWDVDVLMYLDDVDHYLARLSPRS